MFVGCKTKKILSEHCISGKIMINKPTNSPIRELMQGYSDVLNKLTDREVVKTRNNPVGDYTEWLVQKAYGGELKGKSTKGYDLVRLEKGADDRSKCVKYQIKGRWLKDDNSNKQLSIIRDLDDNQFDYLIGVLFTNDFDVKGAWKIPHDLIRKHSYYSERQRGHIVHLRKPIICSDEVINITKCLQKAEDKSWHSEECDGGRERD